MSMGAACQLQENAVNAALERAGKTIHKLCWFQIVETRGNIEENQVRQWQVTLKIGFEVGTRLSGRGFQSRVCPLDAMPATLPAHIRFDERGVPWIDDSNTKVLEVALDMIAHGWSPEEIHFQHPHLTLAQIHAALAYYYDHKGEMDAQIQHSLQNAERLREQAPESPIRKRLREMGKLV